MIDIDPQTNLTFLCATIEQWERRKAKNGTIADVYQRYVERRPLDIKRYMWNDAVVVRRYPISGLDLIPCDIDLLGEDLGGEHAVGTFPTMAALRQNAQRYLRELSFLRKVIEETQGRYDWVIIDCPPNLYLMTQNALHASDYYVVTAIPDRLSTIGLSILVRKVSEIGNRIANVLPLAGRDDLCPIAQLGAIVFVKIRIGGTMITTTHEDTMRSIASEDYASDKVVETYTTELIGYSEAAENQIPVWEHNSNNARRAARKNEYPEITRELITKLR
jgi:chromosome partitioning protein